VDAVPDQYLIIARRKAAIWWLGGIIGTESRKLRIPFVFLTEGNWRADIYQDDLKIPFNPNGILMKSVTVTNATVIEIPIAAGGGFTMKLERQ
jgi:alpha-glucosidase